jgi:hypothetical protein
MLMGAVESFKANKFHKVSISFCLSFLMGLLLILPFFTVLLFQEINQENVKMSNDDTLGDEIPHYQEEAYRQFCYKMLMMNVGV